MSKLFSTQKTRDELLKDLALLQKESEPIAKKLAAGKKAYEVLNLEIGKLKKDYDEFVQNQRGKENMETRKELWNTFENKRGELGALHQENLFLEDQLVLIQRKIDIVKDDLDESKVAKIRKNLFAQFDEYNETAKKLAATISKIRSLEEDFRMAGGPYDFLSTYLGSVRPIGPFSCVPRFVRIDDRNPGEERCFLYTLGCNSDKVF